MRKVRTQEENNRDFDRCLDQHVCPKCGEDLKSEDMGDENLVDTKYTCASCGFENIRSEV
jgi:predicted RNA-binding Zn-ribbon protein involved in translation (DUF1610 family)